MKTIFAVSVVLLMSSMSAQAAPKEKWTAYKSNLLQIEVAIPASWTPSKIPKALAFNYDDLAGGIAGIGFLKSEKITDIEWAADKQFETEGRPDDWSKTPATVGGMRAIKITGTDAKDSSKRFVHYYVETPKGVYIVQCVATATHWSMYSPTFSTILSKLKFL